MSPCARGPEEERGEGKTQGRRASHEHFPTIRNTVSTPIGNRFMHYRDWVGPSVP